MPFRSHWLHDVEWRLDSLILGTVVVVTISICSVAISLELYKLNQNDLQLAFEMRQHESMRREEEQKLSFDLGKLHTELEDVQKRYEIQKSMVEELTQELRLQREKK
jgi:hypothetical protein